MSVLRPLLRLPRLVAVVTIAALAATLAFHGPTPASPIAVAGNAARSAALVPTVASTTSEQIEREVPAESTVLAGSMDSPGSARPLAPTPSRTPSAAEAAATPSPPAESPGGVAVADEAPLPSGEQGLRATRRPEKGATSSTSTSTTTAPPTTSTTSPVNTAIEWSTVFDGYGWTRLDGSTVAMAPMASTQASETHASLVRSATAHGDLDVSLQLRTVRQLRWGSAPNPWEVAWAIWNYTDNEHFYYVILKPNGWELGKEDPTYPGAQRFLATGETPFPIGPSYTVRIRQVSNLITVWADGRQLVAFQDDERPYRSGALALYTEDAEVAFDAISVRDL